MRILIYIYSLECGGAERVISLLANNWSFVGHEVKILTNISAKHDFYEISKNINRDSLKIGSKNKYFIFLENLIQLNKAIREFKPDFALTFMSTSNLKYILSNFLAPKHIHIMSERTNPQYHNISFLKNLLRIFLYRLPSALVLQTEDIKNWFKKNTLTKNIKVINNPIQLINNNNNKNKYNTNLKYNTNNKFKILFVGRLSAEKGIDLLIDAFAKSLKENKDIELTIIGGGPLYSNILKKIKSDQLLMKRVCVLGKEKNIESHYINCNLLVIPSRYEGFPNVLLEGLNHNLNIISTKIIDNYSIFKNIENIKFIEVNDVETLKNAINYFYKKKSSNKFKSEKLIKILKNYELKKISNEWIKLYKELSQ